MNTISRLDNKLRPFLCVSFTSLNQSRHPDGNISSDDITNRKEKKTVNSFFIFF
jgi:hypothetical protein